MEKTKTFAQKVFPSRLISIGFIAIGINGIIKGTEHHKPLQIILASVGMSFFVFILLATYIKKWRWRIGGNAKD